MINADTKVNLSVSKVIIIIIGIISATFTAGITYQKLLPNKESMSLQKKQGEEISDIKVTLARVTTILENMKEKQDDTTKDVSDLQNKTSKINEEVQVISSYVQMDRGKIKQRSN